MATVYGISAIFMWGGLALLGTSTANIPTFQLLFLCFSISASLLFLKRILLKQPVFKKPRLTSKQWFIGVTGLFGFHCCYFIALKNAPAIEVSLISYFWPMLLALFIANKNNRGFVFIGSLFGLLGSSFIIVGGEQLSLNSEYFVGYLLAISCAFIWATYSWFQSQTNNSVEDIGWLSVIVAILSLLIHSQLEVDHWQFTSEQWTGIVLLGLGPVGGAFYFWDIGLKKGNKNLLVALSYSTPLISAVILSFAGLNAWTFNILISLSLILFGSIIVNGKLDFRQLRQTIKLSVIKNL